MKIALKSLLFSCVATIPFAAAFADTTTNATVLGTDSIYNAGTYADQIGSATNPTGIAILTGSTFFEFTAASNYNATYNAYGVTVDIGSGTYFEDPDGIGSNSGENISPDGSISGIQTPNSGTIVGVFLGPGGPLGTTPDSLNFNGTGATAFSSLSPLLDQVFFLGDGLTGDGTGSSQVFMIPTGATELYVGIADACGFNGSPSCYNDNAGSFALTATQNGSAIVINPVSATPEPSSLILLGTGALGAFSTLRRRLRK